MRAPSHPATGEIDRTSAAARSPRPAPTWRATLSAPGSLADGSWVRVSFGPFDAVGVATGRHASRVGCITDKAHRL